MKNSTSKRPFFARVEFRSVQALVEQKLDEGYSVKSIYEDLVKDGRLTMAYGSFRDYVRGGGRRTKKIPKEALKRDRSEILHEIMESVEQRTEFGFNLKSVYQKLAVLGITRLSYSDFCDYFRDAGAYMGGDIPEDFVFFEEDGLITLYYRLESLFESESDKTASGNLQ